MGAFPEGTWSAEGCMEAFKGMGKESDDCEAYCAPSPMMGGLAKVQALCPMGFKAALMAMEVPEAYIEECDYALPTPPAPTEDPAAVALKAKVEAAFASMPD